MQLIPQNKWLYLFLLSIIWGSSYILIKRGLVGLTSIQLGSVRIIFSTVFLVIMGYKSLKGLTKNEWKWLVVTGFLGTFFPSFFFAFAQQHINSSVAAIMNSLTPIFTLLVGIAFFATKMLARQYVGVLLGFIGSVGLIWGGTQINANQPTGYVLLIMCASMCYAVNIYFLKHKLANVSPMAMTLGNFIAILPPAVVLLLFSDFFSIVKFQNEEVITSLGFIVLLAFFGTAIAKVMFNRFIKMASAVFASSVTYTLPVVALFWGMLDGERIGLFQLLATAVILIGVSLAHRPKKPN
ncbi:MAG: EamA family transporter [Bacteroidetes bacterium]|nr:EamA family transporter [Bacteroidota bacterium]MDA0888762.1 EamA family transporter [Bacteroidota bacterium]